MRGKGRRPMRAALLIAVGSLMAMGGLQASAEVGGGTYVGRVWEEIVGGATVEDALSGVGLQSVDRRDMPDWMDEVSSFAAFRRIVADEGFGIVGLTYEGTSEGAFRALEGDLADRGWAVCPSGCEGVRSYVKGKGACRWIMAECAEAGEEASMVLHI